MPKTTEELEEMLQKLRLAGELEFAEKLRLLAEAAKGATKEMSFEDAMRELIETRNEIGNLTGAIQYQEAMMRSQQNAIKSLQEAGEALNAMLRTYQDELRRSEENLGEVTEGLKLAFEWLLKDRERLQEMGGEAVTQSTVVDDATRTLLDAISQYTHDVANGISSTLQGIVDAYRRAVDEAKAIVAQMPAMPAMPTSGKVAVTDIGPQQFGGSYRIGGSGGIDSQFVMARATPGETVTFTPPGRGGNLDLAQLAAILESRPIVLQLDGEEIVVRGYERARRRGRL